MKYIIFGCGDIGKTALECLGAANVLCFADNHHNGETVCGKQVLSFSEMESLYMEQGDTVVVISSDNYWEEMTAQVQAAGLERYIIFRWYTWPFYRKNQKQVYFPCKKLIESFRLMDYQKIGIYGKTVLACLLAEELQRQAPNIKLTLISQGGSERYQPPVPLPQMSLSEADGEIDCLCVAVPRCEDSAALREHFLEAPPSYAVLDLYDIDCFEPAFRYPGIDAYKNIHAGKRIFLIGNGPSLRIEDLNTLHEHGEICIAFNKVYRAYDRTPWRADYLGFTDSHGINDCAQEIPNLPGTVFMADSFHYSDNAYFPNVQYFHVRSEPFLPNYPGFSPDLSQRTYNGDTVVYDIGLQLAAYMGAAEIYLLGVDHTLSGDLTKPGKHFIEDYIRPEELEQYRGASFNTDKATRAYQKAEFYSRLHGFRIFNATRGGKLEVFERVDFDGLFSCVSSCL